MNRYFIIMIIFLPSCINNDNISKILSSFREECDIGEDCVLDMSEVLGNNSVLYQFYENTSCEEIIDVVNIVFECQNVRDGFARYILIQSGSLEFRDVSYGDMVYIESAGVELGDYALLDEGDIVTIFNRPGGVSVSETTKAQ